MLTINYTPGGEAIRDSELLSRVYEQYLASLDVPLTWDVDRQDAIWAALWLLRHGYIPSGEIELRCLGYVVRYDEEFDLVDRLPSDPTFSIVVSDASPAQLRAEHTWYHDGKPEAIWLQVPEVRR